VRAIYETPSPEDFTRWTRDVAPPIVNLLKEQPAEVQERIWRKVTEAWAPHDERGASPHREHGDLGGGREVGRGWIPRGVHSYRGPRSRLHRRQPDTRFDATTNTPYRGHPFATDPGGHPVMLSVWITSTPKGSFSKT